MRYLSEAAKAEYDRVKQLLEGEGRWDASFEAVLAAYAQARADWIQATEQIRQSGPTAAVLRDAAGRMVINPWLTVRSQALQQMIQAGREMGLTLLSHQQADRPTDDENDLGQYGDLFKGRNGNG